MDLKKLDPVTIKEQSQTIANIKSVHKKLIHKLQVPAGTILKPFVFMGIMHLVGVGLSILECGREN